ncbi:MAG TPA: hypothetical protein EYP36_06510 [Calditrichaeota bacterium]|nr:hypothetical protein [Calditrichota bacterium]
MNSTLLIIDTSPLGAPQDLRRYLDKHIRTGLTVYFIHDGVLWLKNEYWEKIYEPHIVYYANALDAVKYNIAFQSDVIFSSENTLGQLLKTIHRIKYWSREGIPLAGRQPAENDDSAD